jgi:maleylpyruvate isomerase
VKLYGYFRSSATHRVRIALGLKEQSVELVFVNLVKDGGEQFLPAHLAMNPMAQIPVLVVQEGAATHHLTQSVAILEYLEERFPQPRLLPEDRVLRAEVRRVVEICNSGVQPLQNLAVLKAIKAMGGDERAFAKAANEKGLAAIEDVASRLSSGFVVGDAPTLADVCTIPQMFSARRFGIDTAASFPRLTEIESRCSAMSAFSAAHPDNQPDRTP